MRSLVKLTMIFLWTFCTVPFARADNDIITLNLAKSHIIDLPEPAGTILIANPAAVNAILDQPQRLILMPLQPTATHMTILNRQGGMMIDATIMVSPRREQAVMVDRHCTGTGGCPASSTHYCTDLECLDLSMRGTTTPSAPPNMTSGPTPGTTPEPAPDQLNAGGFTPPTGLPATGFSPTAPLANQEPLP